MGDQRIIAVDYRKPKYSRRFAAVLIDGACLILGALILFILIFLAGSNMPVYTDAQATIEEIELRSSLYIEDDDGDLVLVSDYYTTDNFEDATYAELNAYLDQALVNFFQSDVYFEEGEGITFYNSEKASSGYFTLVDASLDDSDPSKYAESVAASVVYDFYVDCCENAIGFLQGNADYTNASKAVFWTTFVCGLISYLIAYFLLELMVPLICNRGYRTLGMLALKYARIYVDGLNMTRKRFMLRFLFGFLIHGIGFVAFFIPPAISIAMSMFGKYGQTLPDYLANTYIVDITKSQIYFTPKEYLRALQESALEVQELTPEQKEAKRRDNYDTSLYDEGEEPEPEESDTATSVDDRFITSSYNGDVSSDLKVNKGDTEKPDSDSDKIQ